jgi:sn-glycerol 3-phosphate transport system permease protein
MQQPARFQMPNRLLYRLLVLAALVFLVFFFGANWGGLRALWDLLADAVRDIPDFAQEIIDYFGAVPGSQLWESVLVGAGFGVVTSALLQLSTSGVSAATLTGWPTVRAVLVGAAAGGVGAQILMYPTQHCTYAPEAGGAQYRLGLVVTAFSALLLLVPVWALLRGWAALRRQTGSGNFRGYGLPYLFLLPTLLILVLFLYYPAIQIWTLSLRSKIFPLPQERFVCLQNYVNLSDNIIYRNSFATSLVITFFIVMFSLALSLAIATLASQKIKGAAFYRTLLIWPYAISPVVTGVIFLTMFREGSTGLINWALGETIGTTAHWLTDTDFAPWVIIAASVWNILGFNILFYIAGLQNIPGDLLEAAALDGANRVQRFVRITFPLLSPFTFFLLVTNVTFSFYGIYGTIDTLTRGGPPLGPGGSEGGATNVLIYKLYEDAFNPGSPAGVAAAQAVILFIMVAVFTIFQFGFIERRVTYEG